jgi:hypothetical protein
MAGGTEERLSEPGRHDAAAEQAPSSKAAAELEAVAPWPRWVNFAAALAVVFGLVPLLGSYLRHSPAIGVPVCLAAILACSLAAWAIASGYLLTADVRVGSDGVLLSWMGTKKFVPFSELDVAIPVGGRSNEERLNKFPNETIELHYRDGSKYSFGVKRSEHMRIASAISRRLDAYRCNEAAFADDEHSAQEAVCRELRRSDRPVGEWLAALEGKTADPYRSRIQREQLWKVLRDPSAPSTARAAAAKLLRCRLEDRNAIRVVAEATAQPRMRVALETVASEVEEEEALIEAVACVQDQRPGPG